MRTCGTGPPKPGNVIGVDTYTQHVADATDTPAVTLFTTIDPALYPYYPRQVALTLPGARELPAWGLPKLGADDWARVEPAYQAAWAALALQDVIAAAEGLMADADAHHAGKSIPDVAAASAPSDPLAHLPPGERPAPAWSSFIERVMSRLNETLYPGDTALLLGGGAGELALPLAERLGPIGRLIVMEPRRELQQCLVANLVARGLAHVEVHWAIPMPTLSTPAASVSLPGPACHELPHLYADDDHTPIDAANSRVLYPVPGWPVDALAPAPCRLLVVASPLPWQAALESAAETLRRCQPVLVLGPMPMAPAAACCRWLAERGYRATPTALSEPGWVAVEAWPNRGADEE